MAIAPCQFGFFALTLFSSTKNEFQTMLKPLTNARRHHFYRAKMASEFR